MLNRAPLVALALAALTSLLLVGCKPTPPSTGNSVQGAGTGAATTVANATTQTSPNPLVGTWRCVTDGSTLVHNADGTGSWKQEAGSGIDYHFKWSTEGQSLVLTSEQAPQPQRVQFAFDAAGDLQVTGANGQVVLYKREGAAPTGSGSTTSEPPQRAANRGEGPRMWADEQIEQSHQELIRSAPQLTDTPDVLRQKLATLQAAATQIRASASSGFPDRRAQYEKYAGELEAKVQEWTPRLQTSGTPSNGTPGAVPAQPAGNPNGENPLSSGFGAPPR